MTETFAEVLPPANAVSTASEVATLGGGCFWCLEAVFLGLKGVSKVVSGYAAGQTDRPTYQQVCGGRTGHAEVVQVTFDPATVAYADVLRVFFTIHDPTTRDRQGADVGTQYRSIILTHDDAQVRVAQSVIQEITSAKVYAGPIVTQVEALTTFFPAEEEHQNYFARNPWSGYCRAVVGPKITKFRKTFADRVQTSVAA